MLRALPAPLAAALIATPLLLAACGGRAHLPGSSAPPASRQSANGGGGSAPTTSTTAAGSSTSSLPIPTLPGGSKPTTAPVPTATIAPGPSSSDPTEKAIVTAYETYLVELSGLDDNLSQGYIAPLAAVTTTRLAQASVRQAAAILAAQEHGVGTLRDDHVSVVMTGSASAALADCQDENDFYLVSDDSGTPDPFVQRGDFAGSAQLVLQGGHWLVDVFTTTHVPCSY